MNSAEGRPVISVQSVLTMLLVLSVLYLTLELRHNTQAIRAGIAQDVVQRFHDQYPAVAQSPDLADILLRAARDPDAVEVDEKFRFFAHCFSMFRAYEIAYYEMRDGALDPRHWEGFELQMSKLIATAGIRTFWDSRKDWFSKGFRAYVDREVVPVSDKSDYKLPGSG